MSIAVTVVGHDRRGIIADVTGVLAELGGNIEDSSMTLLRGHFAWTLVADVDADVAAVQQRLAFLGGEGLVVSVLPVPDEELSQRPENGWLVSVHGSDRPGIVSAVMRVLADMGGNVTDLTTRLGADLYLIVAEVELPGDVDRGELSSRLAAVAHDLGVEVSLRPAESDVL
ncbi:MAG: amino acid-binding protein [Actinomycetota bacterium]|nr:MAG: amino acid-binding protein [Actinomycetota bacterium]